MVNAFRDRGYPSNLITKAQQSVPFTNRPTVLHNSIASAKCPYDSFLVLEYTQDLNITEIQSILKPTAEEEEHVPVPCLSLRKSKCFSKLTSQS